MEASGPPVNKAAVIFIKLRCSGGFLERGLSSTAVLQLGITLSWGRSCALQGVQQHPWPPPHQMPVAPNTPTPPRGTECLQILLPTVPREAKPPVENLWGGGGGGRALGVKIPPHTKPKCIAGALFRELIEASRDRKAR